MLVSGLFSLRQLTRDILPRVSLQETFYPARVKVGFRDRVRVRVNSRLGLRLGLGVRFGLRVQKLKHLLKPTDQVTIVTRSYNGSRSPISQVPQLLPVKRYKIRPHYDGVFSLDFTKDGTRLAVGYGSGDVTLHDTKTAKLTCCPSRKSDQLPVTGLQFKSSDRSEMLYCLASGPIFLQRVGLRLNEMRCCLDCHQGKALHVLYLLYKYNGLM